MSDTDTSVTSRDDAGRFASAEPTFGREGNEADAGWGQMPDRPKEELQEIGSDAESLRQAAKELNDVRGHESEVIDRAYQRVDNGERYPDRQSVTLDRAARDLNEARGRDAEMLQSIDDENRRSILDEARSALAEVDPRHVESYGLEKPPGIEQPSQPETTADPANGLDPDLEKALQHPQVRQAIEDQIGHAENARQQYANAVATANQLAQASLIDTFPELGNLPINQWEGALGVISQNDPSRFQKGMGVINRAVQTSAAQAQLQQQQAAAHHQWVENWAKQENTNYERWAAAENLNMAEIAPAASEYLADIGIDAAALNRLAKDNPILRASAFQRMLTDAARYRQVQRAKTTIMAKPLPPALRPGISTGPATGDDHTGRIAALNRQLANASGRQALQLAAEITSLKRRA